MKFCWIFCLLLSKYHKWTSVFPYRFYYGIIIFFFPRKITSLCSLLVFSDWYKWLRLTLIKHLCGFFFINVFWLFFYNVGTACFFFFWDNTISTTLAFPPSCYNHELGFFSNNYIGDSEHLCWVSPFISRSIIWYTLLSSSGSMLLDFFFPSSFWGIYIVSV